MAIGSMKKARWLIPLLTVAALAAPVAAHPPHDEMAPQDPWLRTLDFQTLDGQQLGLTNQPSNESYPSASWSWDRPTLASCCFGWYEVEYEKQLVSFSGDDFPLDPQDWYQAQVHLYWSHGSSFPILHEERPYASLDFYLDDGCGDASYVGHIMLEEEWGEQAFLVDLYRHEEHHEESSGHGNGSSAGSGHDHGSAEHTAPCGGDEPWAHDLSLTLVMTAYFGGSLTSPSLLDEYMYLEMTMDGASFLVVREKPVEPPVEPTMLEAEEVAVDEAIEEAALEYQQRQDPELTVPGPSLAPLLAGLVGAIAVTMRRRRAA